MSELTRCNRCILEQMRRDAEARGVEVIVEVMSDGWISARYSDKDKPSAWFIALTENCVC